jgi:hypothetical protein
VSQDARVPTLLLLNSPLVGPGTWSPVRDRLRALGREVLVADPREVQAAGPVVLVPHSNAGLFAPGLAERVDAAATVYVDAALADEGPDTAMAPPDLMAHLRTLMDPDGMLPPWSRWWPAEALDGLFPDDETRAALERQQPRLPLAYFNRRLPVPEGWTQRPAAYLAFGETYAAELARARGLGWPVERLEGRHLHLLHQPDEVAAAILRLEAQLRA